MSLDFVNDTDWGAVGEEALDEVVTLRRSIHADPEIGLHCPRTTDKLKAALVGLDKENHARQNVSPHLGRQLGWSEVPDKRCEISRCKGNRKPASIAP